MTETGNMASIPGAPHAEIYAWQQTRSPDGKPISSHSRISDAHQPGGVTAVGSILRSACALFASADTNGIFPGILWREGSRDVIVKKERVSNPRLR